MTEPAYKSKEPLPLSVYVSARAGDSQAVERLLRYYDNYMNCLCTRTLYDEDGYEIGGVRYIVKATVKDGAKETAVKKIRRLLQNDLSKAAT